MALLSAGGARPVPGFYSGCRRQHDSTEHFFLFLFQFFLFVFWAALVVLSTSSWLGAQGLLRALFGDQGGLGQVPPCCSGSVWELGQQR